MSKARGSKCGFGIENNVLALLTRMPGNAFTRGITWMYTRQCVEVGGTFTARFRAAVEYAHPTVLSMMYTGRWKRSDRTGTDERTYKHEQKRFAVS